MSTALAPPGEHRPSVTAADRGTTRIHDHAVARLAARAAREALAPYAGPGHGLYAPRARIATNGAAVAVALQIRLPYPADLSAISTQVQDDVARRVAELTGCQVLEVSIDIEHLAADPTSTVHSPAVDLTKLPSYPRFGGPDQAGGDPGAAAGRARVPYRWWSARRIPAALTAILVVAASGLLVYDVVSALQEHPARWGRAPLIRHLIERPLDSAWVIGAAALCTLLGLSLITIALTPGRRRLLPLRPQGQGLALRAVLDRDSAAAALRDAAAGVEGVTAVRVRVRRRITVRADTGFGDAQRIATELTEALNLAIDGLCLAHPPPLAVRTRRRTA
jgi:hypothetical protein